MSARSGYSHHWLVVLFAFVFHFIDVLSFQTHTHAARRDPRIRIRASPHADDDGTQGAGPENEGDSSISPAAVKMDDGGTDLTDRFKYKVHALMGTYDPPPSAVDDENQTGHIIGAMLQFPTEYTFSVVGKTIDNQQLDSDESSAGDAYASEVRSALSSILGSDADVEMRVVPRGKKFTRVSAKVTVESASVIAAIYEGLDSLEATVMKF